MDILIGGSVFDVLNLSLMSNLSDHEKGIPDTFIRNERSKNEKNRREVS
jgi:hypothetical protein